MKNYQKLPQKLILKILLAILRPARTLNGLKDQAADHHRHHLKQRFKNSKFNPYLL